jgi:hypothetical protein
MGVGEEHVFVTFTEEEIHDMAREDADAAVSELKNEGFPDSWEDRIREIIFEERHARD